MKIGIVGAGNIGSTLGSLWVRAGHEVLFSSQHPERLESLRNSPGGKSMTGYPADAVGYADVLLFAVPYGAWPGLAESLGPSLRGKVVIDAANPFGQRDGAIADRVHSMGRGSGRYTASLLPEVRLVKAFNTLFHGTLSAEAHRTGERLAIPVAGDDSRAVDLVAELVRDAGFEPVALVGIDRAADFDAGTPVYNRSLTAAELSQLLGPAATHRTAQS